jgi:N-acetylmuramoyl-L-alanine amidase
MKSPGFILFAAVVGVLSMAAGVLLLAHASRGVSPSVSESEDGFEPEEEAWPEPEPAPWVRPDGPLRVGLQAGHWKVAEVPEELENLKRNTGATGGGKAEWQVNLAIAEKTKALLEAEGVVVDLLPTTIPEGYWADAFVAIHADGNPDTTVTGYKAAAPRRDRTGKAAALAAGLEASYEETTGLPRDPNVTRNMRGYYAFNSRRYRHAIHPMTPGAIFETGFLTNPRDRRIIVSAQDKAARGLADGILGFLGVTPSSADSGTSP